MKALLIVVLLIFSATCHSTTWVPSTVTDPISGKQCHVSKVASYRSYIYQWESKYDGLIQAGSVYIAGLIQERLNMMQRQSP